MESSALHGLSEILGHKAMTVCLIIANRLTKQFHDNYKPDMEKTDSICFRFSHRSQLLIYEYGRRIPPDPSDDPDEEVYQSIRSRILELGPKILSKLEAGAALASTPTVHERYTELIAQLQTESVYQELHNWKNHNHST